MSADGEEHIDENGFRYFISVDDNFRIVVIHLSIFSPFLKFRVFLWRTFLEMKQLFLCLFVIVELYLGSLSLPPYSPLEAYWLVSILLFSKIIRQTFFSSFLLLFYSAMEVPL